ncbi:efflux RND transporter permease subunit [Candidatus Riflebacteria bacterium]
MFEWIIKTSLNNRGLVLVLALIFISVGIYSFGKIPLDAFPETTPVMVQVASNAPSMSPLEIELQVALPIEKALVGCPGLVEIRSISKTGFCQVTLIFNDKTEVYFARQQVSERLAGIDLPRGAEAPEMNPASSGLGEIFHYIIESPGRSLMELTTMHEWEIKPRLSAISGVAEVNTWGGFNRRGEILLDLEKMMSYGFSLHEVNEKIKKSQKTIGGGVFKRGGESQNIQVSSRFKNIKEALDIVVGHDQKGNPILLKHISTVQIGHEIRRGAVTTMGKGEAVLGLGFILFGENSYALSKKMLKAATEIQSSLPDDIHLKIVYQRNILVERVIDTVKENLSEGAVLVIIVLFLLLGHVRAGILVSLVIPLSMLFAFVGMEQTGMAITLLSIGAIDFGLLVDSSIIIVENCLRHLVMDSDGDRKAVILKAAMEVRDPTMFGELIILIVFLPVFTLQGVEGKLFTPMALTMVLALLGAMIFSLTLLPVLASFILPKKVRETETFLIRGLKYLYRPLLTICLKLRVIVFIGAISLLAFTFSLFPGLGAEFLPRLYEMSIVINTVRLAGIDLNESVRYGLKIEQFLLKHFPDEIDKIWTRYGAPQTATDPMGIELSDIFITLKNKLNWKKARTQEELIVVMRKALAPFPGQRLIFTQPIEMRVNEMIAGIRSDIGIKIFGKDFEQLKELGDKVHTTLEKIDGVADLSVEQLTGQPLLMVEMKRKKMAQLGIDSHHVFDFISSLPGIAVGEITDGEQHYPLVSRIKDASLLSPEKLLKMTIPLGNNQFIPVKEVLILKEIDGPSTVTHEWQKRRLVVQCNVRGTDLAGVANQVKNELTTKIKWPDGYYFKMSGQFLNYERGKNRLMLIAPFALVLIFFLIYLTIDSIRDSLIIFLAAPFSIAGGILALYFRKMPFTIPAGIGFIAVCGIGVLASLVLITMIRIGRNSESDIEEVIFTASLNRLRPILTTALTTILGFIPMALNTGLGAEIQRPLATVVIGGIITANLLTLFVLPAVYLIFGEREN